VHFTAQDASSTVASTLTLIDRETQGMRPGALTVLDRLSEVVLIQVLRAWLDEHDDARGAMMALRDPRIGKSLAQIHAMPEAAWTVAELARVAAMSRTSFSERFKDLMGIPPMQYLTQWRMGMARTLLLREELTLPEVAQRVGYASQASFSQAFRDAVGLPPGQYRERALLLAQGSATDAP